MSQTLRYAEITKLQVNDLKKVSINLLCLTHFVLSWQLENMQGCYLDEPGSGATLISLGETKDHHCQSVQPLKRL